MHEALARVGVNELGGDPQQRRLAGAVAADQTDAFARPDGKVRPFKQRRPSESEPDSGELDQGRGHGGP
jgi:hypothetical protein